MVVYIWTKFHENLLDGFKVIEWTRFHGKISMGHNSIKGVGGVMVLVLCTSTDGGLYLYKVS